MYSRLMRAEFTESGNRVAWKWDAVTFLCSALAADTDAIISQIAEVNPYLALECILSGLELSEATTWEVVQHLLAYPRTVDQVYLQKIARALNHMGNAETVSALLEYLHDDIFNQYDIQGVNEVMIMPLKTLGTDTIRFLMDILKGEKWQRRRGAAWALGELKEPAAVPGLVEALRDENENVRREAAYALLRIGRQALPRLLKSLDDADPDMRAAAIKVLGRMGDATAVPNLIASLKDTEWPQMDEARICDLAAIALEHIGTDEAFAAVDTWRQGGKANALSSPWNGKIRNEQPLTVRHNKSADQLVGELQNTEWVKRRDAVKKLGDSGNEDVLPHILSMLKDEDSQVRWTAVQALENFQGPDILQGLLVAIRDDDFLISDAAGKALSKLGELALPGLVEALTHKNVDVRGVATEALGRIGSEEAIPYLADALADTEVPAWEETRVCDIAAAALARINTEKSLFTLENWRKEQGSSYTVPELDIALPLLHLDDISRDGDDDPKRRALIEFLDALHEERWENQRQAAGALKQYAQTLKDTNDEMALQKLAFALEDKHPLVRWTATETLAWTGDTAATPALLQALQDEMWTVRVSAIRALAAVKADTQKTLPGLINALQDKNHVVREAAAETLGLIGDETAGEALTYALNDNDSFVRRAAVEALGRVKDMTVVPILISSLDDEDNNVQWAAVETLGELGDPSAIPILTQYLENTSSPNWEERRLCDIAALALEKIGTDQAKDAVNKWREAH
jgi:HEAT repeat protein